MTHPSPESEAELPSEQTWQDLEQIARAISGEPVLELALWDDDAFVDPWGLG